MDNLLVSSLLKELMTEYNRVSLPCLGSFLGQYKPAYLSDDGKIMPPSKKIAFHQNEIWNDEKLEKLIARREKISLGEAKEKLAFWIDEICVMLATGEQVELPGMGRLRVADRSRLVFEQDSPNLLRESFGLAPVSLIADSAFVAPKLTYIAPPDRSERGVKALITAAILLLLTALCTVLYFLVIEPRLSHGTPEKELLPLPTTASSDSSTPVAAAKYCILMGTFDGYNEARACVRTIVNETPSIFFLRKGKKPYQVSLGEFTSRTEAADSLTALQNRDSVFRTAKIAEINTARKTVNE